MLGLVNGNLASARQPNLGDRAPALLDYRGAIDPLRAERLDLGLNVVAHEVELMPVVGLCGMEGRLCLGKAKDQPSVTRVHRREPKDVTKEVAVSLRVLTVYHHMRAVDHRILWFSNRLGALRGDTVYSRHIDAVRAAFADQESTHSNAGSYHRIQLGNDKLERHRTLAERPGSIFLT